MKHYLFCYGTLRRHEPNHFYLTSAKCIAEQAWTHGRLYRVDWYPALVPGGEKLVYGELYQIDDDTLERIDELEGYEEGRENNEFQRIKQTVFFDRGSVEAYVYVYTSQQAKSCPLVVRNDWKCERYLSADELYYFAYGSCMDQQRFIDYGVHHLFQDIVGRGIVPGYSLRYTRKSVDGGRADMMEIGGVVEGKVYRINQEALQYLYEREGAVRAGGVYRPTFVDGQIEAQPHQNMLTFVVARKEEETAPPDHYIEEIVRGSYGFVSSEYFEQLEKYHQEQFGMDLRRWYEKKE